MGILNPTFFALCKFKIIRLKSLNSFPWQRILNRKNKSEPKKTGNNDFSSVLSFVKILNEMKRIVINLFHFIQ